MNPNFEQKYICNIPTIDDSKVYYNIGPYTINTHVECNQFELIESFNWRKTKTEQSPAYSASFRENNKEVDFLSKDLIIDATPKRILIENKGIKYRLELATNCHMVTSDCDYDFCVSNSCFYVKNNNKIVFFYNPVVAPEGFKGPVKLASYLFSVYEEISYDYIEDKLLVNDYEIFSRRENIPMFHLKYENGDMTILSCCSTDGLFVNYEFIIESFRDNIYVNVEDNVIKINYYIGDSEYVHRVAICNLNNVLEEINEAINVFIRKMKTDQRYQEFINTSSTLSSSTLSVV